MDGRDSVLIVLGVDKARRGQGLAPKAEMATDMDGLSGRWTEKGIAQVVDFCPSSGSNNKFGGRGPMRKRVVLRTVGKHMS